MQKAGYFSHSGHPVWTTNTQLRHYCPASQLFISPNSNCTNASLLLFVNGVRNNQIISNEFYLRFGILNARIFSNFDRISASKIIGRLKTAISSSIINDFLEVVYRANEGLYIEIDGAIFSYS